VGTSASQIRGSRLYAALRANFENSLCPAHLENRFRHSEPGIFPRTDDTFRAPAMTSRNDSV
jgi:hypothetical protein